MTKNRYTIRQTDNGDYAIMLWIEDYTGATVWSFEPVPVQTNIRTWEKAVAAWNDWVKRETARREGSLK